MTESALAILESFLATFARFARRTCDCGVGSAPSAEYHSEDCQYRKIVEDRDE